LSKLYGWNYEWIDFQWKPSISRGHYAQFFFMFRLSFFKRIPGFGFGHSCNVFKLKLGARRSPECRIFHHLPQSFWGPWALTPGRNKKESKRFIWKCS
jgi:hypothetical protein